MIGYLVRGRVRIKIMNRFRVRVGVMFKCWHLTIRAIVEGADVVHLLCYDMFHLIIYGCVSSWYATVHQGMLRLIRIFTKEIFFFIKKIKLLLLFRQTIVNHRENMRVERPQY